MRAFLPIERISDANFDRIDRIEAVEIGDRELVDAVNHRRVTRGDRIEPTATPRASSGRAKFAAHLVQHVGERCVFRRQRAFADTRGVSLHHAEHDDPCDAAARPNRCRRRPRSCSKK